MFGTHLATDFESINARQHYIKNHHIIGIAEGKIEARVPFVREIDSMALFQQDAPQQVTQALLIFHYKDMHNSLPFFPFAYHQANLIGTTFLILYSTKIGNRLER